MSLHWWQRAVFYQIYPRSFADSNGDGIGDLDGITSRLDYLNDGTERSLGIDAIWLNPINPSPLSDWGYDVSDYCGIHPELGTLESFDRLVAQAHRRGIRVIVDLVPNHTSDQHPWFIESRSSRTNPMRDWYIWQPGSPSRPPNNWQSVFGGSAWKFDERTGEHYLHMYLEGQPDLNYRNRKVLEAMQDVIRFWLGRGADGFRVDVVAGLIKDKQLRDNPLRTQTDPDIPWYAEGTHLPIYSNDRPEIHDIIRGFRRAVDEFGDRMMVGETWPNEQSRLADYVRPDELHLGFNFRFLLARYDAMRFRAAIAETERTFGPGAWPTWTLSNHDFPRHVTRYANGGDGHARARVAAVMLMALRGTPFIYYGEEIGMPDAGIPADRQLDPVGRDGCRTPMQWSDAENGGFSTAARTWLPCGDYRSTNVARQTGDPHSMLALYKRLIRLRKSTPALAEGTYRSIASVPQDCLAFVRETVSQRVLVALNLSAEPRELRVEPGRLILSTNPARADESIGGALELAADEAAIVDLK
ncbi:MAG TPA: alpha-amylase family glycosyl hydrolase [Candidatus Binataceae bacterium]|nr:alpha-amylase family glycosyl hydrolase [Candidatus Binataceae bacterium]